ncbi:LAMI_0B07492g1_1 [Lachancea mirantina]|uniref:Sorting nexin MVP1 n=1 Tax=Lachancea mirantina TaxID=1230905 RepID=A0A1G4IXF5_9SACH|nr:LAMI_0B07492g1_1 [Lachancea mirantina]
MSFLEDSDPWNSDNSGTGPVNRNEWADLNASSLTSSSVLNSDVLTSRVNGLTLNADHQTTVADVTESQDAWVASTGGDDTFQNFTDGSQDVYKRGNGLFQDNEPQNATEEEGGFDFQVWAQNSRKNYNPLSADIVQIEEIPAREGILFKHTNYIVKHLVELPNTDAPEDRSVIRRYSDFAWLQEVLLKKYPFRLITDLPPKKIASHNADAIFLEKRRKGLTRFINILMKHPVLSKDDLVLTFLTVPTDLLSWRKRASYDTTEEFTDRKISLSFIKMWHPNFALAWNEADESIDSALEAWARITILVERLEKRQKFISQDRALMAGIVSQFQSTAPTLYSGDISTMQDINGHLNAVAKHLQACNELSEKKSEELFLTVSPKFKAFIDVLLSLKGLFERYKAMAGNNVPQLRRRIEVNTDRLDQMKDKPDIRGAEYDRVKQSILHDRRLIAEQLNRNWLIRECILQEFTIFQETQYLITSCFQSWIRLNMQYSELNANEWEKIFQNVLTMPLSRN